MRWIIVTAFAMLLMPAGIVSSGTAQADELSLDLDTEAFLAERTGGDWLEDAVPRPEKGEAAFPSLTENAFPQMHEGGWDFRPTFKHERFDMMPDEAPEFNSDRATRLGIEMKRRF